MFSGAIVLQGAVTPSRNWALQSVRFQLGVPKQSEGFPGMLSRSGMGTQSPGAQLLRQTCCIPGHITKNGVALGELSQG